MKKIQLHIDAPCQENWASMSPEAQGRFCASCCKTVIDFTQMSDRQLMDYFRNPKEQVCGRFHDDQLGRPLSPVVPASKIPNLLFRYTWPAFVFFLKSCTDPGGDGRTLGKIAVTEPVPSPVTGEPRASYLDTLRMGDPSRLLRYLRLEEKGSFQTLGFVSPYLVPDTVARPETNAGEGAQPVIMGDTIAVTEPGCNAEYEDTTARPMDTVTITAYPTMMGKIAMGAVSAVKTETVMPPRVIPAIPNPSPESMNVFPNPAAAGSLITVAFEEEGQMPRQVELFSIQGGRVLSVQQPEGLEATVFNLRIPAQLAAGTYILRLSHPGWKAVVSRKIIIQ